MKHAPLVLLLACAVTPALADEPLLPTADVLAQQIELSPFAVGCTTAVPKLEELVSRPDFESALDARQQSGFLTHLAMCLAESGRLAESLEQANRAATADPGSFAAQGARMTLGVEVGRPADAIDAADALATMRPAIIREMTPHYAEQILKSAGELDGSGRLQLRFYDTLERVAWAPPPPFPDDYWRVAHGRLLVENDRFEDARRRLAPVTDPVYVVAIRSDRIFDPLRKDACFEAQLAFPAAIPASLERGRVAMEQSPRRLAATRNYVNLLEDALRFDEVLRVTESALNRYQDDPSAFDDADGNLNWMISQRVHALNSVGRFDDGQALAAHSIELSGPGQASDSNLLNYASDLVWESRPQEALALLLKVNATSSAMRAWVESTRACAAVQLGESATLKASLDYLRAHEADEPPARSTALLCANEMNEAAALMIRRLGNRHQRQRALAVLQVRPLTQFDELPARKQVHDRLQALRDRDDVRAAVEAIGRIEVVPVIATKVFETLVGPRPATRYPARP